MWGLIKILLSMKWLRYLAGIIGVISLLFAGYNYVYKSGYDKAKKECTVDALNQTIVAKDIQIANLQKQLTDIQVVTENNQTKKQVIVKKIIIAKQVVQNEVKDNSVCNIGFDVIRVLNDARSTTSSNHK